jgi:hypothetical protein
VVAVNGCCYGKDEQPEKDGYFKYCGQRFWNFLSGEDSSLYTDIVEPLASHAKERNEVFQEAYARTLNLFTHKFFDEYCYEDGSINWQKLVVYNSGIGR